MNDQPQPSPEKPAPQGAPETLAAQEFETPEEHVEDGEELDHVSIDGETTAAPQAIRSEVRDYLNTHERRRKQIPRGILVGVLSGLAAVVFRVSLEKVEFARDVLFQRAHEHLALVPLAFLWAMIGGGASVWLVRRVAPDAAGSGIPQVKAVLHALRRMSWQRILPVKFFGGVLAIGGGLAMGKEGPTVQMGAAIGQMVGGWLHVTQKEKQTLIAAGTGAGLAATFNAPLAGLMFVLEEVQRDFSPIVFTITFVAAVCADVVGRVLTGQAPTYHVMNTPVPPLEALPLFVLSGLIAGLLGVVFNRSVLKSLDLFGKLKAWPIGVTGVIAGLVVALLGWFAPGSLGSGHDLVQSTLAGHEPLWAIPGLFLIRFAMTIVSYGSGAPGGIFAPLLVVGAQIGLCVGLVSQHLFPTVVAFPETFAVVGMAAYFTAIVRAPLTGIVLIVEMTNGYSLILPLLAACLVAYAVADMLGDLPLYEALLERNLKKGDDTPHLEGSLLLELPVQTGSPYDGKMVRELGLPPGCVLVSLRRGVTELVPVADTELQVDDWITAVIAPQAAEASELLHHGTEAPRRRPRTKKRKPKTNS